MTNQERIIAHNSMIDEAIAKANALPDVTGGGGSGETVEAVIQSLTVTENGTYNAPSGVDGYNPITVNVPIPDGYIKPSGTKSITSNGTHDVASYSSVNVDVPTEGGGLPSGVTALASGTVTPTSDATSYLEVRHDLGVAPNFLVWQNTADFSNDPGSGVAVGGLMLKKDLKYNAGGTNYDIAYFITGYNANAILSGTALRGFGGDDDMNASTALIRTSSTYPLKAGHTYHWVCGVME